MFSWRTMKTNWRWVLLAVAGVATIIASFLPWASGWVGARLPAVLTGVELESGVGAIAAGVLLILAAATPLLQEEHRMRGALASKQGSEYIFAKTKTGNRYR